MIIAYDEKARVRDTVSGADEEEMWVTLTAEDIAASAIRRSSVLKCALESQGESALPVKPSAFRLWLSYVGDDESLDDCCTVLKVWSHTRVLLEKHGYVGIHAQTESEPRLVACSSCACSPH